MKRSKGVSRSIPPRYEPEFARYFATGAEKIYPLYIAREPTPPYRGLIFKTQQTAEDWIAQQDTNLILERHDKDGGCTRIQ